MSMLTTIVLGAAMATAGVVNEPRAIVELAEGDELQGVESPVSVVSLGELSISQNGAYLGVASRVQTTTGIKTVLIRLDQLGNTSLVFPRTPFIDPPGTELVFGTGNNAMMVGDEGHLLLAGWIDDPSVPNLISSDIVIDSNGPRATFYQDVSAVGLLPGESLRFLPQEGRALRSNNEGSLTATIMGIYDKSGDFRTRVAVIESNGQRRVSVREESVVPYGVLQSESDWRFNNVAVNNNGQVLIVGGTGIWLDNGGVLRTIVDLTASENAAQLRVPGTRITGASFNNNGDIVFSTTSQLMLYDQVRFHEILSTGVPVNKNDPDIVWELSDCTPTIGAHQRLLFTASQMRVSDKKLRSGLFSGPPEGPLELVLLFNDFGEDQDIYFIQHAETNSRGQVAVFAQGQKRGSENLTRVYGWDPQTGLHRLGMPGEQLHSGDRYIGMLVNVVPQAYSYPRLQGGEEGHRRILDDGGRVVFPVTTNPWGTHIVSYTIPGSGAGDANGDGQVNAADLSVLLARWGQDVEPFSPGDFNGDGVVSAADLSVLLSLIAR